MQLTRDDERARRICSLALEFMNATAPIPSTEIARSFYPDLSADSFRRAFSRDRETLATCGVFVEERPWDARESAWGISDDSFAGGLELEPREASALEVACAPLLDDPGFPLAGELRLALAKITRAFAEAGVAHAPAASESRALVTLRSCLLDGVAARITYEDARGRRTERTIAPYGMFDLRGLRYVVAGAPGEEGDSATRTYRVDRVVSAEMLPNVAVRVPADFSVDDWRRLPFQLGDETMTAVFEVLPERADDVRRAAGEQGSWQDRGDACVWRVGASDVGAAASWAISQGIRPLGADELVLAWRRALEGVVSRAS
ncbi:helix-turn-helix transcriptional regulator [Thermophilibacter provencensis]|uniref:WYL domain-containing protein n=1 Tax=Thermophilibacter provencensis TaxID=1852386 RepID=A0ABT7V2J5_9ACTN|nr:WYL domain-containing protein [Thermophilibacter provencensis]MDM8270827.1 WYL domain-containing protein [Thermophilibacter provencensis]